MAIVRADNKRRIVLREARPGEVYDVEYMGGGIFRAHRMRRESARTPGRPESDPSPSEPETPPDPDGE